MPYYINTDTVTNMYQLLLNRYTNIDFMSKSEDITLQASLPLSELTCGKILQGNATITISKHRARAEIDISSRQLINIYVGLENMLHEHNIVKTLTSAEDLENVQPGDIVEFECIFEHGDDTMEFLSNAKSILEFQDITENTDNSKIITWIEKNLAELTQRKPLKYTTSTLCSTDTHGLITICKKNSLTDMECYLGRQVSILGEVTAHSTAETNLTLGSEMDISAVLLNKILSENEKYKTLFSNNNYNLNEKNTNNNKKFIEIVPFIIYL